MKKVKFNDALNLFATYRKTTNVKIFNKAIKMSTEICVSPVYDENEKIVILREILTQADFEEKLEMKMKEENKLSEKPKNELELEVKSVNMRSMCIDFISGWRDSLLFLKGVDADNMISLLRKVVKLPELPVADRIYTAVYFYNACKYHVCYPCFADLAEDKLLPLESRLEVTKFLFASGEYEEREIAKRVLLNIITDDRYNCEVRYGAIRSYIPNTGIRTLMNTQKLKVPYDEEFVYQLQSVFFGDVNNIPKYRVLSGQHQLQMMCVFDDRKKEIVNELFNIGDNEIYTENTRADALSVVLRLGDHSQQTKAREKLATLGNKSSKLKFKTIYDNSQNIHDKHINESIITYLEKIVETPAICKQFTLSETIDGISSYVGSIFPITNDNDIYTKKRHAITNALSRVKLDTATFTKYNVTSVEVLCHVYSRVYSGEFDDETMNLLKERLIDELIDMDDTCSDGANRFVNVFSGFDNTIKISWEDQITANVSGRINAKVRSCENIDLQATLTFGMMEDADETDKNAYVKFVVDNFNDIEQELYGEFVKGGYVTDENFTEYMKNIREKLTQ